MYFCRISAFKFFLRTFRCVTSEFRLIIVAFTPTHSQVGLGRLKVQEPTCPFYRWHDWLFIAGVHITVSYVTNIK
jgi:hypothetical protein